MQRCSRSKACCYNSRIPLYLVIILIKMIKLKKTNYSVVFKWGAAIGILGLILYPVVIGPMLDSTDYKKIQKVTRAGIDQEKIQPGNMKVWSDPFKNAK